MRPEKRLIRPARSEDRQDHAAGMIDQSAAFPSFQHGKGLGEEVRTAEIA